MGERGTDGRNPNTRDGDVRGESRAERARRWVGQAQMETGETWDGQKGPRTRHMARDDSFEKFQPCRETAHCQKARVAPGARQSIIGQSAYAKGKRRTCVPGTGAQGPGKANVPGGEASGTGNKR
jgi:hypothetical protein